MPRQVQKIYPEDRHWYVPDIDNNRKEQDPFRVSLSSITSVEKQRIQRTNTSGEILERYWAVVADVVSEHVHDVKGYEIQDRHGEWSMPKNGVELVDAINAGAPSEMPILEDIMKAIENHSALSEGELGNSSRPSDSSTQTAPKNSGRAKSVAGSASEKETKSSTSESKSGSDHGSQETATSRHTMDSGLSGTGI